MADSVPLKKDGFQQFLLTYAEAKVERILHDFFLLPYVKQYSKKTRVLLLPSFPKDILLYVLGCFLWLPLRVSMDVPEKRNVLSHTLYL